MDDNYMPSKVWDEIDNPYPNFNGITVEVWEWMNIFIPHIIMDVISNSWWDQNSTMLVKAAPGEQGIGYAGWMSFLRSQEFQLPLSS